MKGGNFKAKCIKGVDNGIGFTTGETYEVINGNFTYDSGKPSHSIFKNVGEMNDCFFSQFERVD